MNSLDAGNYYVIWTVVGDSNYESITREYINFQVKVNPNKCRRQSIHSYF